MEVIGSSDAVVGCTTTRGHGTLGLPRRCRTLRAATAIADPRRLALPTATCPARRPASSARSRRAHPPALCVRDPRSRGSAGDRPVLVSTSRRWRGSAAATAAPLATVRPLCSPSRAPADRVVLEVEPTTTLGEVVTARVEDSPDARAPQAVLLGGYGGSWVSWPTSRAAAQSTSTAGQPGLSVGAGLVGPLPATACGLRRPPGSCAISPASRAPCGPCVSASRRSPWPARAPHRRPARRAAGRRAARPLRGRGLGRGACRHPDGARGCRPSRRTVFDATCTGTAAAARATCRPSTSCRCRRRSCDRTPPSASEARPGRTRGDWPAHRPGVCDGVGICAHLAPDVVASTVGLPIVRPAVARQRPSSGGGRRGRRARAGVRITS